MKYASLLGSAYKSYHLFGVLLLAIFPSFGFIFDHMSSGLWYLIMLLGLFSLGAGHQWKVALHEAAIRRGLVALGLYLAVMLANVALIDHGEFATSRMERQLLLLGMPLCLVWLMVWQPSVSCVLRSFAVGAIIFGVYSLWFRLTGQGPRVDGVTHAIHFGNAALLLALLSPLPLVYEKRRPAWLWSFCLAGVLLGGLTSLWSGSRGGWVALPPLGLIVLLIIGLRRGRPGRVLLMGGILLAALMGLLAQTDTIEERWEQTLRDFEKQAVAGRDATSIGRRFIMWESALGLIQEAPILGQGFSAHGDALQKGIDEGRYTEVIHLYKSEPHNQYLFETTAKGLVGLASFLFLMGVPLAILWKPAIVGNRQVLAVALVGILTISFYLIYGMTITVLNQRRVIHMFGFLYAIILYLTWRELLQPSRAMQTAARDS